MDSSGLNKTRIKPSLLGKVSLSVTEQERSPGLVGLPCTTAAGKFGGAGLTALPDFKMSAVLDSIIFERTQNQF